MAFACSAIILIVVFMFFILARSGRGYGWSIGILPLLIIPVNYFISSWISLPLSQKLDLSRINALIVLYICALILTYLFIGMISLYINNKRSKFAYIFLCAGFSTILTFVFISRII